MPMSYAYVLTEKKRKREEKVEEERSDRNLIIDLPELAFPNRHLGIGGSLARARALDPPR